jgi:hypothetical protein
MLAQASRVVKEHPLKTAASILAALTPLVGALLFIDSRYAHAEDTRKSETQTSQAIKAQTTEFQKQHYMLRQSLVEDKLFEIDLRNNNKARSPIDEAQYRRYSRQLTEINTQINTLTTK